jgi:hypothetical protein
VQDEWISGVHPGILSEGKRFIFWQWTFSPNMTKKNCDVLSLG